MNEHAAVYIRPHLVSFLFQELEGDTKAEYATKKIKIAKVTKRSALGQLLHIFKSRAVSVKASNKVTSYNIFLSLDTDNAAENKATINQQINFTHTQLELRPEDVKFINDYLEGLFRLSFVAYVKGYAKSNDSPAKEISSAIHQFMMDHNLYDTETDPEALRRLYYREVKKNHLLHRFQIPISSQIKNYACF